ncbi:hypothetical protein G7Z17_g9777 [Cylindrodendrum hubeiense]|uniref:Calcineurin-like phosphoesterase domain-containing protein n=1 Tax=Cylindrodendrum hubeiense TaxID=595255 RepID=A0A9P5H2N9_9HYPO|nr:hypothetical protein G7Z17_g9777 [Cylindrodendrum hubeiense]
MVIMIGAAQRRFLVFASTLFFVSSLYICISRLVSSSFKPVELYPENPEIKVEYTKADMAMSYGHFGRPGYDSINMMAEFPRELIPTAVNGRRLIIVGDIHGMLDPLNELLKKTKFDPANDHLISVGDTVNKGPNSAEVVHRLMELKASAVRGNHEDRVLVAWAGVNEQQGVEAYLDSDFAAAQRGESLDVKTARSLNATQIEWLESLPVILTIEPMSMYIVHAGLVPGLPLQQQDPWAVMNMRTMRFPRAEFREEEETKRRKAEEKKKKQEAEKLEKEAKEKEEKEKEMAKEKEKESKKFQQRSVVKRSDDKSSENSEDYDRKAVADFLAAAAVSAEGAKSSTEAKSSTKAKLSTTTESSAKTKSSSTTQSSATTKSSTTAKSSTTTKSSAASKSSATAKSSPTTKSTTTSPTTHAQGTAETGAAADLKVKDFEFTAAASPSAEPGVLDHPDHDIWIPVDNRAGEPWSNIWNHVQRNLPDSERRSIIYGHDAKRGYQEDSYTFGLDSGCVKGNALTALVISADQDNFNYTTVQVMCKEPKKSGGNNWW